MNREKIKNEDLGYNSFFEAERNRLKMNDFPVARVISELKEAYRVKNPKGEFFAKITGKQIFTASSREDYPAVGDWVVITELDEERAVIRGVFPRMTMIKRKYGDKNRAGEKSETQIIATNIDVAFVVESVDRDYNLNRFERYFAIAENGGVKPAIILNKIDLLLKEDLGKRLTQLRNRFPGIDIILTSVLNNEGLNELRKYIIKGKTYCFLGSSGVGKSSLINKLIGEKIIKTEDISSYSGRGKHATTSRQMYFLDNGGIVIDNPGIREVGMTDVGQGINITFSEIAALAQKCRYTDCAHTNEPGCEVIKAVKSGRLDKEKYSNYINLRKEAEYYEMSDVERREKDRQFGKFVKNAIKDLKKYKDN
ncbi:MAG: ribosome small subunit-dependent GTPase A [Candidatus Nealsonbacteria bacterium RIFOXYB1_FULL_40_15]|uniref:Small ribosomal subunit biogenesis GTPase RsgA n=2 Tax=Candidatus Nealsoniibacteriota TaxID=1817911 RepID=A0A1G2ELW8_9BACT|nr:MAG: ribosome small subunit-dependent GTPase A [Candidatus Nealsonbacteria bacterium RIFOXYC1_FULL_40_7]OGZ27574.1 MAG: ribosome small subunit-dependent GTPase A [Candidatus Nealsonbacteria bacterium RIFOXYB1_FULL_40_15]